MSISAEISELEKNALEGINSHRSATELEELRTSYLGKKGKLTAILRGLKDLAPDEKKEAGARANEARETLEHAFLSRKEILADEALQERIRKEKYDSLQPRTHMHGRLHPITRVQYEAEDIFLGMGFSIMDGPETESDENNFTRLNFSADHPARDLQDTYWTEDGHLLRTHTSPVQVRAMQNLKPPFRIIAPGRVFRYEDLDASHENTFYQIEGMMVDREVSIAHLIYVMKGFLSSIFGRELKIRLRPGYFPFVEPGFELDINCLICNGKGCRTCKHEGWIEFMGCGLIHPEVLRFGGIDPGQWSGFAFGMGLDRLVMLRYGIEDIRHFMSGNMRFLRQF